MTTTALAPRPAAAPESPARSLVQESAPAAEPFALLMGRAAAPAEPPPAPTPPDSRAGSGESAEPENRSQPSDEAGSAIATAPSAQAQMLAQAVVLAAAALPPQQPPAPEPQAAVEPVPDTPPALHDRGPVEPAISVPLAHGPALLPAQAGPGPAEPPESHDQAAATQRSQTAVQDPLAAGKTAAAAPVPRDPPARPDVPAQRQEPLEPATPGASEGSPVLAGGAQPAEAAARAVVEPASREGTETQNALRVLPPEPAREQRPADETRHGPQAHSGREGATASPDAPPVVQATYAAFRVGDPSQAPGAAPAAEAHTAHAPQRLQVAEQVVRHLEAMRLGAGRQEAVIQLEPERLGRLHISLSAQNTDVTARILADNPAARQALEEGRDHLRAALEARGFSLNGLDVGLSHHQQERGAFQRAVLPHPLPPAVLRGPEHAPSPAAASARPRPPRAGLDLRA